MSPLGILLAGAGAAVGIITGLGIPVAAVALGAPAWGGRVAVAVPRNEQGPQHRPLRVGRALAALRAPRPAGPQPVRAGGQGNRAGPIRDRLASIGDRIDDGVAECGGSPTAATSSAGARAQLDPTTGAAPSSTRTQAELAAAGQPSPAGRGGVVAVTTGVGGPDGRRPSPRPSSRLRLLDARLDEAVARAIELSVGTGDEASLSRPRHRRGRHRGRARGPPPGPRGHQQRRRAAVDRPAHVETAPRPRRSRRRGPTGQHRRRPPGG